MNAFTDLLKWKDSQGLVFWMLDDYQCKSKQIRNVEGRTEINEFWYYFNEKLINLYDPVTKQNYKPLKFDEFWWNYAYNQTGSHLSKYDTKIEDILFEIYYKTMKYKPMQELIHQSNPNSFNVVISYNKKNTDIGSQKMIQTTNIISMFNDGVYEETTVYNKHTQNCNGQWFISSDYDPYDIDLPYIN